LKIKSEAKINVNFLEPKKNIMGNSSDKCLKYAELAPFHFISGLERCKERYYILLDWLKDHPDVLPKDFPCSIRILLISAVNFYAENTAEFVNLITKYPAVKDSSDFNCRFDREKLSNDPSYAADIYRKYGYIILFFEFADQLVDQLTAKEKPLFWNDCLTTGNLCDVPFQAEYMASMCTRYDQLIKAQIPVPCKRLSALLNHALVEAHMKRDTKFLAMMRDMCVGHLRDDNDFCKGMIEGGPLSPLMLLPEIILNWLLGYPPNVRLSLEEMRQKICKMSGVDDFIAHLSAMHDLHEASLHIFYPDADVVDSFPEYKSRLPCEIYMFVKNGKIYRIPMSFIRSKLTTNSNMDRPLSIKYPGCPTFEFGIDAIPSINTNGVLEIFDVDLETSSIPTIITKMMQNVEVKCQKLVEESKRKPEMMAMNVLYSLISNAC
jgi:hypothetical protein